MNFGRGKTWITGALIVAALAGCRADPAPSVGFAGPTKLNTDPNIPFNRFWRKPNVDWKQYNKMYVADVNTAYMLQTTDWQKGERKADIERDVQTIAVYAHDTIAKAFSNDPNHRFTVVTSPAKHSHALVLEVALIEVVPSKILLNALSYAPFFIGTGITVARTLANDKSSAAFEARVRDASTGEVVMLAADRESEQLAIVDLRGLTWYSDVDGIIDGWSTQIVQVVGSSGSSKVDATPTFRLLPW